MPMAAQAMESHRGVGEENGRVKVLSKPLRHSLLCVACFENVLFEFSLHFQKRCFHCRQMQDSSVQTSIIRFYGSFLDRFILMVPKLGRLSILYHGSPAAAAILPLACGRQKRNCLRGLQFWILLVWNTRTFSIDGLCCLSFASWFSPCVCPLVL